jgi:hypothetical protein
VAQLPHCDDGDDDDEHAARRMLPIKVKFAPGTTVEDWDRATVTVWKSLVHWQLELESPSKLSSSEQVNQAPVESRPAPNAE